MPKKFGLIKLIDYFSSTLTVLSKELEMTVSFTGDKERETTLAVCPLIILGVKQKLQFILQNPN